MNIAHNQSQTQPKYNLYTGPCVMTVLALNPTDEQIVELTGGAFKKMPYTNLSGVDAYKGVKFASFCFLLYNEEHKLYTFATFKVTHDTSPSKNETFQYINTKLQTKWGGADKVDLAEETLYWIPTPDIRLAYRGEANLAAFFKSLANMNVKESDFDFERDCKITDCFSGNFSTFKKIFDEHFKGKEVRVLLSVTSKEDNGAVKHYQSVETDGATFTHSSNTSVVALKNALEKEKIKPRGIISTEFKVFTPEETALAEGVNDLPF